MAKIRKTYTVGDVREALAKQYPQYDIYSVINYGSQYLVSVIDKQKPKEMTMDFCYVFDKISGNLAKYYPQTEIDKFSKAVSDDRNVIYKKPGV